MTITYRVFKLTITYRVHQLRLRDDPELDYKKRCLRLFWELDN